MAFSPDGSRIAGHYGISRHTLNLWDLGPTAGLGAEPEPGDLAGWLRRSRALAEQGDLEGAEAASARARTLEDGDPSPWIEHALSLWRRGDAPQARDALDRAMHALPDDAGRWIDLGRLLARFGRSKEAETALAKGRSLLERRLSRAPDDETAAGTLAALLPDAGESRSWTILRPDVVTSAAGATLTRLPDGSVLAGGLNPVVDTYTVEAVTTLAGITALRLEALPDPSLPLHGPGRQGNFHLDEVRLSAASPPGDAVPVPVHLCRASADYWDQRPGYSGVSGTLDADTSTFWSIWPRTGRPHCAVFQAADPIGTGAGTRLRVELASRTEVAHAILGRFRLSVTNRPVPFFGLRLMHLKADTERHGLARLGAAYSLLGDWASAAAVLERAAARRDGSALDGFVLALAHHHLGRAEEARSECDRALARLRTDKDQDAGETHDVALEVLTTIRGLSLGEAESVWQDLVFPADPFAR
jgi:tetratricopeptide (TPR) repeat protein